MRYIPQIYTISLKKPHNKILGSKQGVREYFVVYSHKRHVPRINKDLLAIKETLEARGYTEIKLGDQMASNEYYFRKLQESIEKCVLGIIVLDGLRPNIVFEWGFLEAMKKPIITLKSKYAFINIENLYEDPGFFRKAKLKIREYINPRLHISQHLSDMGGIHISEYVRGTNKTKPEHISNIIIQQLHLKACEVSNEMKSIMQKSFQHDILGSVNKVIECYDCIKAHKIISELDLSAIKQAYEYLEKLDTQEVKRIHVSTYKMIAEIYALMADEEMQPESALRYLELVKKIYQGLLETCLTKFTQFEYADITWKLGDIYYYQEWYCYQRQQNDEAACMLRQAINRYEKASEILTKVFYEEYAFLKNKIGNAYLDLVRKCAITENHREYIEESIDAFQDAKDLYEINKMDREIAIVNNNLGMAFLYSSKFRNDHEDHKKALALIKEARDLYKSKYSVEYSNEYNEIITNFDHVCHESS
jgi:tetratricopeptide (TPR) repeat protein